VRVTAWRFKSSPQQHPEMRRRASAVDGREASSAACLQSGIAICYSYHFEKDNRQRGKFVRGLGRTIRMSRLYRSRELLSVSFTMEK
jgi:RNase P/RNase MRP subunit p30